MPSKAPQPVPESSGEHPISAMPPPKMPYQETTLLGTIESLRLIVRHVDERLKVLEKAFAELRKDPGNDPDRW